MEEATMVIDKTNTQQTTDQNEVVHSGFPGDGHIYVVNNYKGGDVYFKLETNLKLNDFDFKNDGAYKIGTQSWIPLDGINVNGKVYKISDGYDRVYIDETGKVEVLYTLPMPQFIYWLREGSVLTLLFLKKQII